MHYYPEDQSKENLEKIRRSNVCLVCGRMLMIYIDLRDRRKFIACSGQVHEGIAKEYKPPRQDYQTNIRRSMELEEKVGTEVARTVGTIPRQGQLTQPQAEHILSLVYPDCQRDEIIRCAIFCRDFGLHPLAKEVYLIPFKDKNVMVVGIPASRKMAHSLKGAFSFLDDTPRTATEEEVIKQYGKDSEEAAANVISVTKLQGASGNLAIGFGLWPKLRGQMAWDSQAKKMVVVKKDGQVVMESNEPYGFDKGNTKRNMANIRSERQAMDRLPGKPMPRVEVIDEAYAELPEIKAKVDPLTGEILEGEFKEVPEPETHKPEPEPEPTPLIDHNWFKESLGKLQAAKLEKWANKEVLARLNIMTSGESTKIFQALDLLGEEQAKELVAEMEDLLAMQ